MFAVARALRVLMRVAYENGLYMRLFNKTLHLAQEWLRDTEKFREKWTIGKIRQMLFQKGSSLCNSHTKFYGELCKYAHPSSEGGREQRREGGILWRPMFNADNAEESIGLVLYVIVQTWRAFAAAMEKQVSKDFLEEIYSQMKKNSGMLERHFVIYTKTEDINPRKEPEKVKSSVKN